jgi:hypothetical protein
MTPKKRLVAPPWVCYGLALATTGLLGWVVAAHPWSRHGKTGAASERVVAAFTLTGGDVAPHVPNGYDRLRIPPDATDLRVSVAIAPPAAEDRLDASVQSVDSGAIVARPVPVVDRSNRRAVASVILPVPPDGDYVLRIRRVAGADIEVLVTTAFRVTRSGAPAAARGLSSRARNGTTTTRMSLRTAQTPPEL